MTPLPLGEIARRAGEGTRKILPFPIEGMTMHEPGTNERRLTTPQGLQLGARMGLATVLLFAGMAAAQGNLQPIDAARLLEPARSTSLDIPDLPTELEWEAIMDEPVGIDPEHCAIIRATRDNPPRLVLTPGGHTALVRTLAFSPDGGRLYSAGQDKAVLAWDLRVDTRAIVRAQVDRPILTQTLRWEIARGPLGTVYAMAASPVDRRLAIAGFSARVAPWGPAGDIVLYDTASGQVERALRGHSSPIVSLDFAPDGQHLVSVAKNGEVRLWSQANDWIDHSLREPGTSDSSFQPARFLDDGTIALALPEKDGVARIALRSVEDRRSLAEFNTPHRGGVLAIARGPGQRWASSDREGNLYLWQGREQAKAKLLRKDRPVLGIAFTKDGTLYASTAAAEGSDGKRESRLEAWSAEGTLLDQVATGTVEPNFSVTISPDSARLITIDPDADGLLVFRLSERGQAVEKPLSSRQPVRLRGAGAKVWKVAFADAEGYRIGFSNEPTQPIDRTFDFTTPGTPKQAANESWRTEVRQADGWFLANPKGDRLSLQLGRAGAAKGTIDLDPQRMDQLRTFTFLTRADGKPYAIAIGTAGAQGIFVFGLAEKGPCPLIRYFRDHHGMITSLSTSRDGKYLLSGSFDQTIKVWSLEALDTPANAPPPHTSLARLGASLEKRGNRLVVADVLNAGTFARKGIRQGDIITRAKFNESTAAALDQGASEYEARDADRILAGLSSMPLFEYVTLTIERQGRALAESILMIPAWSPAVTFYTDRQGRWAIWTPQGYYDASADGEELFGWQMNRGWDTRPDFFRSDMFRNELERPGVLRRLLPEGNLASALRAEPARPVRPDEPPAAPIREVERILPSQISNSPVVTIVEPKDGENLIDDEVEVVARVDFPNEAAAERHQGAAFINGVPGEAVEDRTAGKQRVFRWKVPVADRYNRVRVVAEAVDPQRRVHFSDVHFRFGGPARTEKPRMHILTLAVSKYQHVPPLRFTLADADAIRKRLETRSGKFYEQGEMIALADGEVSREGLTQAIERLATLFPAGDRQRSDDLLVVFLAGHGIAMPDQYYFVPAAATVETLTSEGIGWSDLRKLSKLPCRKVFLLDTCHSGNIVATAQQAEDPSKASIRPLKEDDILVVAATDAGQEAIEFEGIGHGIFTLCLLEGMDGKAADAGGDVFLDSLAQYVVREVPLRTRSVQLQTPRSSPTELFDVLSIPITEPSTPDPSVAPAPATR